MTLNTKPALYLLFIIIWLFPVDSIAQELAYPETLSAKIQNIEKQYIRFFEPDQLLKNGKIYEDFYHSTKGHPFLGKAGFQKGNIVFQDLTFYSVDLNYDIYKDLVITLLKEENGLTKTIILDEKKISGFQINNQRFYYLNDTSRVMPEGFYQLVFNGEKHELWVKRRKLLMNNAALTPEDPLHIFTPSDKFYIKTARDIFPIKDKRDLLEVFKDIKPFLKQSKIRLRPGDENKSEQLTQVLQYYENKKGF